MKIDKSPFARARLFIALAVFLLAFGVRLLSWHDTRLEVGKVQTAVTVDYRRVATLLRQGGIGAFFSRSSALADLHNLGHPPGYSILLGLVGSASDNSNTAIQLTQITGDALSAVIIFLIVAELVSPIASAIAGLLAALSPQFAWNSVLLLPDSLSVLPILLAVYVLVRATKNPALSKFILAGALIGLSCWFRPNTLFLGLLVAGAVPLLIETGRRWSFAGAVLGGALLIILPLTIRNAVVFHSFIPLSLGAGQTLLEGIADYDEEGRFGIPATDIGIMKQEADQSQRPDYNLTLFRPDGVERERARLARGFAVIRSNPIWFAGVMVQRAGSMVRLERARLISIEPPVSHSLDHGALASAWSITPAELIKATTERSPQTRVDYDAATDTLRLVGDESRYGTQISSSWMVIRQNTDYLFVVPVKIERGRMKISVVDQSGAVYSSAVVEPLENRSPEDQLLVPAQLPFVSREAKPVHLIFSNEASDPLNPILKIGTSELYELGYARFLWTRYPRVLVHAIQKVFLTAVMLPLAILGLAFLILHKHRRALVLLSVVPVYFFTVQSILHTEYRYLLALDYFLFAFAAIGIGWVVTGVMRLVWRIDGRRVASF